MQKFLFLCLFLLSGCANYKQQNIDLYQVEQKQVEIKGAVQNPGIYEIDKHDHIEALIKKAGGLLPESDISQINLLQDIPHLLVVHIPTKSSQKKISINTGTLTELTSLPNIGVKTAQNIIEYRKQTPFYILEDLKNVKGIKDKLFEKIKEYICL